MCDAASKLSQSHVSTKSGRGSTRRMLGAAKKPEPGGPNCVTVYAYATMEKRDDDRVGRRKTVDRAIDVWR